MIRKIINKFKNLIKFAKIVSTMDDLDLRLANVSYLGKEQQVLLFTPYGLMHNPPVESLCVTWQARGEESNMIAMADDPNNRTIKNLEIGEVAISNYETEDYIHFKNEDGTEINGKDDIIVNAEQNIDMTSGQRIQLDATTNVQLFADSNIRIEPDGDLQVTAGGNSDITATGTADMEGATVTITGATITLDGDVTITGATTATTISATSMTVSGAVTISGLLTTQVGTKDIQAHTHTGGTIMPGGFTGPPT